MRRRDLIAAGTTLAAATALMATASSAVASEEKAPEGAATTNIAGVGLPVIVDGRLRNYVFVTVKVTLGEGTTIETMHTKDPFIRDALVRASHRVSFATPDNWIRLNENAINAAVMAIAELVCGHGAVTKSEVLMQLPRRRTGLPGG
ncbi:hypothetical protein BH09PSE1_BH09PSE1_01240 [soil metagenome]